MKVGIIGSGVVGQVLASAFLEEGNDVMLGTRNTSKDEVVKWQQKNQKGQLGSFEDTAKFGEILVLAISGMVASEVIDMAGKNNFSKGNIPGASASGIFFKWLF